ncbi:MAG TPA: S9 family peptidase [Pyrinomonadaceae bacterium]|jgi:dipeptidyl aminopeptidase/acylaminoacyl peptidase
MRRACILSLPAVLLALALAASAFAAGRDRLGVETYLDWEYVSAPQVSPDGTQIVYTRRWTDKMNDRFEDEVWLMDADGGRNRFLVKGAQPRWSPDGRRLAYVAQGQPAGAQIFVKWLDAAEASQLTHLERGPGNIVWSPDGKQLAFTMLVPATQTFKINMPPRPAGAKWIDAPRVVDRLDYRNDGSGWRPEGFTHLFVVSAEGGTPRQLTEGDFNHGGPEWLDAENIVFSSNRHADAEYEWRESDIYAVNTKTSQIRQLTDRRGPDFAPAVSPDGKQIAYLGYDQTDDTYIVSKLYVMNADGTNKRLLNPDFDRSPADLEWTPDGRGILFTAEDQGSNNVYYQPAQGGPNVQATFGVHQISLANISRSGLATGLRTTPVAPNDVITMNHLATPDAIRRAQAGKASPIRQLTAVNEDVLAGRTLGQFEEIWYDSVGGKRIQGWLVKPPDFDPAKKYPLILYIHGGPHAMYGVGFNFEFQQHAAEGYVVLYTNPRGSTGYGQAFGNAIKNNYPGDDYTDLMNGVDELLKRGYVDANNLFVCGGSGGGVLTSWIVGHTDRFAAAVVMKPVVNWYSFVGTTDSSSWYYNFAKLPWEDPAEHLRRSPITYVGNVKTPTMLLVGELDLRTPLEQTEQYYRALKLRKVPTLMVRLPDEYHGFNAEASVRHPSNRIAQILYLRGWFDKYRRK